MSSNGIVGDAFSLGIDFAVEITKIAIEYKRDPEWILVKLEERLRKHEEAL
jgi:hypothetical protein